MIKEYTSIIGTRILHFDNGQLIGLLKDIIINPDSGKIEAFWINTASLAFKHGILQNDDIVEWKKHIYVRNEHVIAEPDEIIRIKDVLDRNTQFIGNSVKGESESAYGKVYSLDFDSDKGMLRYIYSQKSFLGINGKKFTFHYKDIVKTLPDYILVKDNQIKSEEIAESSAMENKTLVPDA